MKSYLEGRAAALALDIMRQQLAIAAKQQELKNMEADFHAMLGGNQEVEGALKKLAALPKKAAGGK